jgi:hypothetical protein
MTLRLSAVRLEVMSTWARVLATPELVTFGVFIDPRARTKQGYL